MRPEEVSALGELAGDAVRATSSRAHEIHTGIAGHIWKAVGPAALPVRVAHDAIARGAYFAAGELSRAAVRAGAGAASRGLAAQGETSSLEDSAVGRSVVGVLNGAFGDSLHQRGNRLALPMTLRHDGRDLEPTPAALRQAYPAATSRLAVLVHGLGRTEAAWLPRPSGRQPYGERLRAELGYTPVYVRYNTGRHISENGRELAELVRRVISAWPTEVGEIALVGHSVGGLVVRSACHYGAGSMWVDKVRQVFTLGSPHGGSPVERLTSLAGAALAKLPETRPLARTLNARSAGIKDLGRGSLLDEEWQQPEAPRQTEPVPFLRTAEHYFISAPVHRRLSRPQRLDMLDDPAVYEQLRRRLRAGRELPPPRSALPAPRGPETQRP